jgi:hypothetical protein
MKITEEYVPLGGKAVCSEKALSPNTRPYKSAASTFHRLGCENLNSKFKIIVTLLGVCDYRRGLD